MITVARGPTATCTPTSPPYHRDLVRRAPLGSDTQEAPVGQLRRGPAGATMLNAMVGLYAQKPWCSTPLRRPAQRGHPMMAVNARARKIRPLHAATRSAVARTLSGMSTARPPGRQLEPIEAFEVTPWRALDLFRIATLVYAIVLTA